MRIWDLRKFHSIGKLSGGHQAAIMCLATGPTGPSHHMDTNYVITGSKDHYIKVSSYKLGTMLRKKPFLMKEWQWEQGIQHL